MQSVRVNPFRPPVPGQLTRRPPVPGRPTLRQPAPGRPAFPLALALCWGSRRGAHMLQRDYVLEIVGQFVDGVSVALRRAALGEKIGLVETERQIGDLLELEPQTALALAPDSLVTMMLLSGMGDSVAEYVGYALDRLARLYESAGDEDTAGLRRLQAKAVGESFGCDPTTPPSELAGLDAEVFQA